MIINIEIKNVYGNELVYPLCETAKKLCSLTGKKTLSYNDLYTIQDLGYTINIAGNRVPVSILTKYSCSN